MMNFTFYKQETEYTCGAASMRMALDAFGIHKSEKQLAKLLGTNKWYGTCEKRLPELAEKYQLSYMVKRRASLSDIKRAKRQGYVIILSHYYPPEEIEHYVVLKKLGPKEIHFWDPYFGPNKKMSVRRFMSLWRSTNPNDNRWFFAVKK